MLDGATNMARDEHLLYADDVRPAALRIYGWEPPTISLGYFQRYADTLRLPPEVRALPVVRRPTGGGAILHDREVTYCLVVDESIDAGRLSPIALYRLVHGCWRDALLREGYSCELAPPELPLPTPRTGPFFCFQKPGQTDLIVGNDKLLGSAQRRIPGRVLQHGSLLLGRRFDAHPGADLGGVPEEIADRITAAFVAALAALLKLEPGIGEWTPERLVDVARRREVYASTDWLQRR